MYTRIDASEVQIWTTRLDVPESEAMTYAELLSPDERERAARFVFEKDRRSFYRARGTLRFLLADYLGIPGEALLFRYSARGKPQLTIRNDLRFNVSHSGGLAIFAFTGGCDIGVDVERVRHMESMNRIAERFFSQEECMELLSVSEGEKPAAFFRCWTRKEAYIKATGEGLSTPLDSFQVAFNDAEDARLIQINNDACEALRWSLHNLTLSHGYVGCVAYRDSRRVLRMMPPVG